jgi:predicted MFS family arabinose efflux permease
MVYLGWSSVGLLFALVFLSSTAIAVNQPSRLAIVPNLVGRENLHAAVAINSLVSNAGRFLGPAVAGISIAQWGVGPAFAIGAVFFGFPALTLLLIKAPREEIQPSGRGFLTEVADGMVYTFRHPGIGPLMASMIVTSVLGKAIVAMFPAFSSEIFHRGAEGQAWLTGIIGGGAILGGLFMAQRGGIKGLTRLFILTIALIGAGLAAFAATDIFWVALLVTATLGAALLINGTAAQTLIQNTVEGQMRGRVASVYIMTQRGGQSLGGFILGVLADIVGLRTSVAVAGAVCLGFWLWSLHRSKSMTATLES